MIEILLVIVMSVAAVRSANSLRKQRDLFQEFGPSAAITGTGEVVHILARTGISLLVNTGPALR